jgi:hypothetical protein
MPMKLIISFVMFYLSMSTLLGQTTYLKTYGGSRIDVGYSIASTFDGGFILTGWTESEDGDFRGMKKGDEDVIVIKFTSLGEIEWKKSIGGTFFQRGYSIKTAIDNGYVVSGYTDCNDGDFDGMNKGDDDAFVIKMDSLGNLQWSRVLGGSKAERATALSTTLDGGYAVVGFTNAWDGDFKNRHNTTNDLFVAKLDSAGRTQMADNNGGGFKTDSRGLAVTVAPDNGIVIGGITNALPGAGLFSKNDGSFDCFITKADFQWYQVFGGSKHDECKSLSNTTDGGVVMVGITNSSDGDFQAPKRDSFDIFVIRTDGKGNMRWNRTIGGRFGDFGACVTPTLDGGFVVAGHTESDDADFEGMNKGKSDVLVFKTDAKGSLKWIRTFGGRDIDEGKSIIATRDGNFIVTGISNSNDGDFEGLNKGSYDLFVMKLDSNGNLWRPTSTAETFNRPNVLSIMPNPSSTDSHILYTVERPSWVRIELINSIGEVISTLSDGMEEVGTNRISINTSAFVSGSYLVRMIHSGGATSANIVIFR